MNLRHYQAGAVSSLRVNINRGLKSQLLVIPTGGGKTVVFTTIAKGAISKGKTVMIVCDRKELISQAGDNLGRLGLIPTIIAPGYPQNINNCYLASVDTLRRRTLPKVDIIIIDEAHKQTFDKLIQRYRDEGMTPLIIGATATPLRTGNQNSLSDYYETIVEPTTTDKLLNEGFLVPCRTFAAKMDLSAVKMTGGDYNNAALYTEFNKAKLYDGVIDQYEKFAKGKKTLIFNVNVQHSKNTVEAFTAAGYKAKHLDGSTPKELRRYLLESFHRGEFDILSNCSVLTTGYDEPSIEAIIMNRATKSLPLYLQMAGRGSRLHPGKSNFVLIDMGANCYEHGLWSDPRDWNIIKKKRNNTGVAPVKLCPKCEAMNPASAAICLDCKFVFPVKEKKLLEGIFVEVKATRGLTVAMDFKNATLEQLKAYEVESKYKQGWAHATFKRQNRGASN